MIPALAGLVSRIDHCGDKQPAINAFLRRQVGQGPAGLDLRPLLTIRIGWLEPIQPLPAVVALLWGPDHSSGHQEAHLAKRKA